MAEKLEGAVIENSRPAKAPVIRRVEVAEEDLGSRMLTRFVPALVISGAIHVVMIGFFVLMFSGAKEAEAKNAADQLVTTQVEEPKEEEKNLINE